jgi:hypothetical protein
VSGEPGHACKGIGRAGPGDGDEQSTSANRRMEFLDFFGKSLHHVSAIAILKSLTEESTMNTYLITFKRMDGSKFETQYAGYDLTHAVEGAKVTLASSLGETNLFFVSYVRK